MIEKVLSSYGIDHRQVTVKPHGTGLINNTWIVNGAAKKYILQRINQVVFTIPENIADNIRRIAAHLQENHPGYLFPYPEKTINGDEMVKEGNDYFRLQPYIPDSHTIDVADTPQQAYEAAHQFGLFTRMLSEFPALSLKTTIPGFHDLTYRYHQFEEACKNASPERLHIAANTVSFIREHNDIVARFREIPGMPGFKLRVTHHDTKISNVLFDGREKGMCVIDLDTVMSGYFISDVGDMMRTYLPSVSEEEKDFSKIDVREEYFNAILHGYFDEMAGELSDVEMNHFVYAGKFMIYMQAVRFLADYLNNDIYYGAAYELHNYNRAVNQVTLLQRLMDKEEEFVQLQANFRISSSS
ncbi:MAG: aminoglycoside phosphotransferase family protein [Flavitalea sp.]